MRGSPHAAQVSRTYWRVASTPTRVFAWRAWEALGRSKRYPFLWRIETVKREETRRRKIEEYVQLLAEGKTLR